MKAILLNNIRSLVNVGSIFRTSDGCGIDIVYLTGYTPSPPRKEISKVALGAQDTVPWEWYEDPYEVVRIFQEKNIPLYALETGKTSCNVGKVFPPESFLLIVGNEKTGIEDGLQSLAQKIMLPMLGNKESLNVAVASSIALYWLTGNLQ